MAKSLLKYFLFGFLIGILITPVVILNTNSAITNYTPVNYKQQYITHSPISINGNGQLATYADAGNGTKANPYIIENYFITSSSSSSYLLTILSTNAYFIVRNVIVKGGGYGVYLDITPNGLFENCTAIDNAYAGFYINAQNDSFVNNSVIDSLGPGFIVWSTNDLFYGNIATNNAKNGFLLAYSATNNKYINNRVFMNLTNDFNDPILLSKSSGNLFENNTIVSVLSTANAFEIDNTANNTFVSNNIYQCNGFNIVGSTNTTIFNNTLVLEQTSSFQSTGIEFDGSNNNSVLNNLVVNFTYGIYETGSANNIIYLNTFMNQNKNDIQGYSSTNESYWSYGKKGNYWSDYNGTDSNKDGIGDTPYALGGPGGAEDPYPLMTPVRILPQKQTTTSTTSTTSSQITSSSTIISSTITTSGKSTPISFVSIIVGIMILGITKRRLKKS